MPLTARCHSLRPERHSGWLAFFELSPGGKCSGHFLVIGPSEAAGEREREAALRAGQAAVRYLKEIPENAPNLTVLESTFRVMKHEAREAGVHLEFGCAVLDRDQLWFHTEGRVRLVPLSPETGRPLDAQIPLAAPVAPGTRFFLGRLPLSGEADRASRDFLARLEHGGGGDGGLVIAFAEGSGPQVVEGARREPAPAVEESAAAEPVTEAAPDVPEPAAAEPPARTPAPGPVPGAGESAPAPSHDAAPFEAMVSELQQTFTFGGGGEGGAHTGSDPEAAGEPADRGPSPEPMLPEAGPESVDSPGTPAEAPVAEAPAVAASAAADRDLYAPEERRGLGFWVGVVAAALALALLIAYLAVIRPRLGRGDGPRSGTSASVGESAPNVQAENALLDQVTATVLWEDRFDRAITSSPLVAGRAVIFGCRDGRVYALEKESGERIWAYAASEGFGSSPALAESTVVIGGYDGRLYALDLDTGSERWNVATAGRIVASPAVDAERAYVGSYDRNLYAVGLADGRVRWKRDLGSVQWSSPVVAGETVVSCGLDGKVTALDAGTGRVRWEAQAGDAVYGSPVVAKDQLVVGSVDHNLYAFDLAGGAETWRVDLGSPVNGSPAYQEGRVVVGTGSGTVFGVDLELGKVVWKVPTGGEVKSRPAFFGRTVWVSGYDGFLHGIEWLTGSEAARIEVDSSMYSSPAVENGTAYLGAMDGRFLAARLGLKAS